jgi:hypothetical protein
MNNKFLKESNSNRDFIPIKYSDLETIEPSNMEQNTNKNSIEKELGQKVNSDLMLLNSNKSINNTDYHNTVYSHPEKESNIIPSHNIMSQGPTLYSNVHYRAKNLAQYQNSPPKKGTLDAISSQIQPQNLENNFGPKVSSQFSINNIENYRSNLETKNILSNKIYAQQFQPEINYQKTLYKQTNKNQQLSQKIPTKIRPTTPTKIIKITKVKSPISPYDWQTVNNSKKIIPPTNYNTIDEIDLKSNSSSDLLNTSLDSNKSNFAEKLLLLNKFLNTKTYVQNSNKDISAEHNLTNEPHGANIGQTCSPNSLQNQNKFSTISKQNIPAERNLTIEPV